MQLQIHSLKYMSTDANFIQVSLWAAYIGLLHHHQLGQLANQTQLYFQVKSAFFKAGRLVGSADCYAAIVLADNATFYWL